MAAYSTGITVTWGTVTFTEITGLGWSYGGENVGRSANFSAQPGSVSVTAMGTVPTIAEAGSRATLTITGGSMDLTVTAVLRTVSAAAQLNGVSQFTADFAILDN